MSIGKRFILVAIIYATVGMSLGIYIGVAEDPTFMHLHAHINLVGWVSMALFGLIYKAFPSMAQSKIGTAHFYLANAGALFLTGGIFIYMVANGLELPVILGAILTVASMITFLVNFIKNAKE